MTSTRTNNRPIPPESKARPYRLILDGLTMLEGFVTQLLGSVQFEWEIFSVGCAWQPPGPSH